MSECVVISGGSRGLGLEIVENLLGQKKSIATFARKATPDMDRLAKKYPEKFLFEEIDISDTAKLKGFLGRAEKQMGPVKSLVNNAAIGQDHLLAHMGIGDIERIIAINLTSTILLTRLVIRGMLMNGSDGRIVNISSICGSRGFTGLSVYSATKGALDAFTRSLARELGEKQIFVNSIAPGFFDSEMSSVLSPRQMETIRRRSASGRLSEAHDILPVLDLLLFNNHNITGQIYAVDGGSGI